MVATKRALTRYTVREWDASSCRVDTAAGLIHNVKVLGRKSKNRREYTESALDSAVALCEGVKVYLDHKFIGKHPTPEQRRQRQMRDWAGTLVNCRRTPDGVRADIRYLKSSPAGKLLEEAALKFPEKFGLSQHAVVEGYVREGDRWAVVERIVEVKSVDVVDNPATVTNLYESVTMDENTPVAAAVPSLEDACLGLQNAIMASSDWDDQEKVQALKDFMKFKAKLLGTEEAPEEGEPADAAESVQSETPAPAKRGGIRRELREVKVRQMVLAERVEVEESVIESMVDMSDDAVKALIASLKKAQKPRYGASAPARVGGRKEVSESAPAAPAPAKTFTTGDRNKLFAELQD